MVLVPVLVELTLTEVKKMTCPAPEEWQPWGCSLAHWALDISD